MSDSFVRVPPDSTGRKVETEQLVVGANTVERQRVRAIDESADNIYGEQPTVTSGSTATLVTFSAPAGWRFYGFIGGGEADGKFMVQYDAATKYVSRTNISRRDPSFILPVPDPDAGGTVVTVKVTNTSDSTAAYEATLLGA